MIFNGIKSAINFISTGKDKFPYGKKMSRKILDEVKRRSAIPMLKIKSQKKDDDGLRITDSKFGGYPYWEKGRKYPAGKEDGSKLILLAQLNFEQMIAPKDFPDKGILQFFVKPDDLYGCDFGSLSQKNWRIVYHEDIKESLGIEELKSMGVKTASDAIGEDEYLPLNASFELAFDEAEDFMGPCCEGRFEKHVREIASDFNLPVPDESMNAYDIFNEDVLDEFWDKCDTGHKIGGYPYFSQYDPRNKDDGYDILLLQVDTDEGIMWGDSGVGNFFIKPDDLKKRDFSNVLYNWDCC